MKTRMVSWLLFLVLCLGFALGVAAGFLAAKARPGNLIPTPEFPTPIPTTPAPSQPAYPPPRLFLTDTAAAYPFPNTTPQPVPSSTPTSTSTVYRASIQTLSPTEWMAVASQMAPTPTLVYTPLIPKHDLHITFVDRLHGWITGSMEWGDGRISALAATFDGGITWRALPVPSLDPNFGFESTYLGDYNQIRQLFTDAQTGWWMYQKWLFRTGDGGQTWRQEHPRGTIIQMGKAKDGTFWALEQIARRWTLWRVTGDSYNKWTNLGYHFPLAIDGAYLSVIDDQQAWMTYGVSSHQGGVRTWTAICT